MAVSACIRQRRTTPLATMQQARRGRAGPSRPAARRGSRAATPAPRGGVCTDPPASPAPSAAPAAPAGRDADGQARRAGGPPHRHARRDRLPGRGRRLPGRRLPTAPHVRPLPPTRRRLPSPRPAPSSPALPALCLLRRALANLSPPVRASRYPHQAGYSGGNVAMGAGMGFLGGMMVGEVRAGPPGVGRGVTRVGTGDAPGRLGAPALRRGLRVRTGGGGEGGGGEVRLGGCSRRTPPLPPASALHARAPAAADDERRPSRIRRRLRWRGLRWRRWRLWRRRRRLLGGHVTRLPRPREIEPVSARAAVCVCVCSSCFLLSCCVLCTRASWLYVCCVGDCLAAALILHAASAVWPGAPAPRRPARRERRGAERAHTHENKTYYGRRKAAPCALAFVCLGQGPES